MLVSIAIGPPPVKGELEGVLKHEKNENLSVRDTP
jgi:hypothetical protein